MGITIHLNGVEQALAIAVAVECSWVRAFELANAYVANAGIIEASGPAAMRYRSFLCADDIMVFGDFHVKHGSHHLISDRSVIEQAEDVQTALGDGVIVTGVKTGVAPQKDEIMSIRDAVSIPILIGSGLDVNNLSDILPLTDGAVVGSAFKEGGELSSPVDKQKVKIFMQKVNDIREKIS
jgi:membrane complex biogenesis BtpA family protein